MDESLTQSSLGPYPTLTSSETIAFRERVLTIDKYRPRYPWHGTSDPYAVFVAEVLLRKTRASDVLPKYDALVSSFPAVRVLASADVEAVRKLVRPLGLPRRADTLVEAARMVVEGHGGVFPNDARRLTRLPGVGRYIANAILCIGFGQSRPMLDEGVGRLLRRYLGVSKKSTTSADSALWNWADTLFSSCANPPAFNLSLIHLSKAVCKPRAPSCSECPLKEGCSYALKAGDAQTED